MLSDKYIVKKIDEDDLMPEETLADALSGHSAVEIPVSRNVFRLFYGVAILAFIIFAVQAFRLQVAQGARFALLAEQSRRNQYPIPALRGVIFDRNGIPLVQNVPVFDLVAVRSELAESGVPQYAALLEEHKNEAVFVVERNLSKQRAIEIQAAPVHGLYVVPYARREYANGPAFAHVLGYVGSVNNNDREGRAGVEASYDSVLHGEAQWYPLGPSLSAETLAKAGSNVQTNLDKHIH